ncbi:MAG: hypothetical protein JOY69_07670 [Candidatus Eremiobacteraeota bacterium]|nr:hypothetical protein [Candidatus Eremiobacteraeota bacterium]
MAGFVMLAQASVSNAPADRYFGNLNMSALRIRYETMQLKVRYEKHQLLPEQAEHLVDLTENAFEQWARAYPKDTWLPSTGFALAQLYCELPGAPARGHCITLLVYVKSHFPTSSYAGLSRSQLHRGIPTKPDPAWASAMRATPPPSPAPSTAPSSPAPSSTPGASPATSPNASGSAAAKPTATPSHPPPGVNLVERSRDIRAGV